MRNTNWNPKSTIAEMEQQDCLGVAEARKFGYGLYQFEAQLALYEIDLKSARTATARSQLISFEKDARAKGYGLIARKAFVARGL